MAQQKNVFVTGGTSGIGLAIAQHFARAGHSLVLVGSDSTKDYRQAIDAVEQAADQKGKKVKVVSYGVDITDLSALKVLMADIHEHVGVIDVLVHSAGVFFDTPIAAETSDAFERMMKVNVNGTWNVIQAALPFIRRKSATTSYGKIIAISSISGFYGFAKYSGYSASKAAVTSLVKTLALELGPLGININAVEPGRVKTSMHDALLKDPSKAEVLRQIAAANPSGRAFSTPEDIANVVEFLAGDGADALHGTAIVVDEGTTAGMMG
ncbi:SDR family oxidoreductase [Saccharibacter sp. 17.LH.SD]|uniref:SDR family NAD(P)-dependent oxidoreductase n=1 Tax=Saccharibacter sp. 17.LH.SD TaxID=2689393 RepID=UPI00136FD785|nr:SDR family oxidoreductase [Saccharibacter sp. 17.LH.SD]